jgi:GNAT superfamily N-acetyltransferase
MSPMPRDTLFQVGGFHARELRAEEMPLVQALFEASPEYFQAINGRDPAPGEAQAEFEDLPPAELGYTRRWFLGLFDGTDELVGIAVIVSDLCAARVWHIALFLVAPPLRGTGAAARLHEALEAWMQEAGARWLRLGVVAGNAPAERFWAKCGYSEVRLREGVDTGGRLNTVRVIQAARRHAAGRLSRARAARPAVNPPFSR